ncbi:MAG TPA: energy transducer TonB [Vitreimonas sp.]|uniref:energy transducer TonB n=1 Tax=Vitreimonas sp. TaxID=3069702 RepID=UPI002D69173D|nr:energy transducer TonB [Vitreimonas sp.]HYD89489.1 energy transducer TonB [Vitreimonas sp.]
MRPLWQAAAFVGLVAATGVAMAQQAGPAPITEPVWLTEPPQAQFHYPFSTSEYQARVPLQCRVERDTLAHCEAPSGVAENFRAAAIEAASQARIAAQDGGGAPTDGRPIAVMVRFPTMPLPVAVDPPPAPPNLPVVTSPTWLQRPTAQDFVRYYPSEALRQGVNGEALLECIVGHDGRLTCVIVSASPEGAGFEQAALRVSRHFRMAPMTRDGQPTSGGRVRIPIRFWAE